MVQQAGEQSLAATELVASGNEMVVRFCQTDTVSPVVDVKLTQYDYGEAVHPIGRFRLAARALLPRNLGSAELDVEPNFITGSGFRSSEIVGRLRAADELREEAERLGQAMFSQYEADRGDI